MSALVLLCLLAGAPEPEAIRALPRRHQLTIAEATEHAEAACEAAQATGEDMDVLLALAWHESNYTWDYVQPEPGRRVSCGVMTPEPLPRGQRCGHRTHADQYLDGALHLAYWRQHLGSAALYGYAGGRGLYRACARDPRSYPRQCAFPDQMLTIAKHLDNASAP